MEWSGGVFGGSSGVFIWFLCFLFIKTGIVSFPFWSCQFHLKSKEHIVKTSREISHLESSLPNSKIQCLKYLLACMDTEAIVILVISFSPHQPH